jgi:hypothetical protein
MAINVLTVGSPGLHTFAKTTVNTDEDFIYFKAAGEVISDAFVPGTTFIYEPGVGTFIAAEHYRVRHLVKLKLQEYKEKLNDN